MKNFFDSRWQESSSTTEVTNPFDGSVIDSVPRATADDVRVAVDGLVAGAETMKQMPAWKRADILFQAARLIGQRERELATLISREEGKPLRESRAEVRRSVSTMQLSGEEAKRIGGEVIPLDSARGGENRIGFTLRVPCGIVAAITPFNFPLNLVCHKAGPAIAAGNSLLIKPATDTPLSALTLIEILLEAGLPENAIAGLTGRGSEIGAAICADNRIRKISFTGSVDVGKQICASAGLKRVTMELGSNSPMVILPDADLDAVASAICVAGFSNAGQVCISAQRLIVDRQVHDELAGKLIPLVGKLATGDPLEKGTVVGPMVRQADAIRVQDWIDQAVGGGAKIEAGGRREDSVYLPTVISGATPGMKIVKEELFGPAVALMSARDAQHAMQLAGNTRFGLSAAIYTRDIHAAMQFARQIDSGNIHINGGPQWRSDGMPYGGLGESGIGKEGPRYAIEEMTETKMVVIHQIPGPMEGGG